LRLLLQVLLLLQLLLLILPPFRMTNVVDDETVLSTLVGENGEFDALVQRCFRTGALNTTWGVAKHGTIDEFLNFFKDPTNPEVEYQLRMWINYYQLKHKIRAKQRW